MKKLIQSAFLTIAFALSGCAFNRPSIVTIETNPTNGIVSLKRTHALTLALWPATADIAKQKLSNGKTHSIGIYDMDLQTGSTNLIELLKVLDSIAGKIH